MSVFIDTGVFYAHQHEAASCHDDAMAAIDQVLSGEYGQPFTSDYVYDETVTLVRKRTGQYRSAKRVSDRIVDAESPIPLLNVSPAGFRSALNAFERYRDHELSFTDASTITLVDSEGIDSVLSFDDDFDGIVDRLGPTELT